MKRVLIFLFIFLLIPAFCFAQEIEEPEKEKIEISPEAVEKKMSSHAFNLKQLIKEAEKNIKKVDTQIRNQEREVTVRQHFEKGNQLYQEGKLKEAKKEWQEALSITKDPEMKEYIRQAQRRQEVNSERERARQKEIERQLKQLERK